MNNYYLLSWKHTPELASAFYDLENRMAHELIPQLDGKNSLTFDFELKRVRETRNGLIVDNNLDELKEFWLDYLPNNFAWPLMSEKLKLTVEQNLFGNEHIDWITCKVKKGDEHRTYFILRFNKRLDVLDMTKTKFVQGSDVIIKPVFSLKSIMYLSVFMATTNGYGDLWKISTGLYISENLKKDIKKHNLTGMDFEKILVQ